MLSCLIPQAYEVSWTRLDDGVFNSYPTTLPANHAPPLALDNSTGQTVSIPYSTTVAFVSNAILPANRRRAYLLIQNNSVAGGSSDVLPTLYVAYDGPVPPAGQQPLGLSKAIAPGSGIVLDHWCPTNAIYVRWGTFTNVSGTAFAGGVIEQGQVPLTVQ